MLRNEEVYKLDYDKNIFRAIKSLTNTTIDVEKYINDCINDYELFRLEDNKFFSNSLLKRMEEYDRKKAISRENGKKGGAPKGNQNAKKTGENNQKTTQNNQQVDLKQPKTTQNNQSKVKKSKVNKSKENNNNLLNYTKLNLLFNYLIKEEENFEDLQNSDRERIIAILEHLQIYPPAIKYLPENEIIELKIKYWIVKELCLSSYKIYLNQLNYDDFMFRFLKGKEYVDYTQSDEELTHFVGYVIKSIQEDLK